MRLGFACHWTQPRESTWSGTPWRLRRALMNLVNLMDVGAELSWPVRPVLRLAGARRTRNGWVSTWRYGRPALALVEADLCRAVQKAQPDVVLEIQDLAVLEVPFLVFQDLSYSLLLERFGPDGIPHFRALGRRRIDALRRRQERIYDGAACLLPMSRWMARNLAGMGVLQDRIQIVNPGINAEVPADQPVPLRRQSAVSRLLMVGRDFDTKGGAQLVSAFRLLRRDLGQKITLTIAGPRTWPLRSEIPQGVDFLGQQPVQAIASLMDSHDLFVMPSLFEGFGIAFAEALVRGLPCIGRDDCAMPEIIDESSGGRLVRTESPQELADLIAETLADDGLYAACAAAVPLRRAHYRWSRAAQQVVQIGNKLMN